MEKERSSGDGNRIEMTPILPTTNPNASSSGVEKPAQTQNKLNDGGLHPAFYIIAWISASSSVILFNKWILHTLNFPFPILLTAWHLGFGTLMTQLMARFTTMLDSRKTVKMTGRVYLRAIVPIGIFFSLSLICGNVTYLYLNVAFIQMLKATTPVAVLLASWGLGLSPPSLKTLGNVSFIVVGVIIASASEIHFVLIGVLYQAGGIIFEALRLALVGRLLNSSEFKMDPMVSLYYFAPICAVMNFAVALVLEVPKLQMADIARVGYITLLANAICAFGLNVCVVLLIGKTSPLVMTLAGVLKDILLVLTSMLIFGDTVTGLQFFGYSIALAGMVYYRLGYEQISGYFREGRSRWAEFGATNPGLRRIAILAMVVLTLLFLLGGSGVTSVESGKKLISDVTGATPPVAGTR